MDWKLPTRPGVKELTIDGVPCWARYTHDRIYGKDFETWKIELPGSLIMSIIRKPGSYGYDSGLYEAAFMNDRGFVRMFSEKEDDRWGCDDVLGWLTEEEVVSLLLNAVSKLKAEPHVG
jgi:hypothetical protein